MGLIQTVREAIRPVHADIMSGPPAAAASAAAPESKAVDGGGVFIASDQLRTITHLFGGMLPDTDKLTVRTAYAAAVTAYACIRYRAEKLIEAPLYVFDENRNGDREYLPDHELAPLLEEPNLDADMADLLEETQVYFDIGGRVLWWKIRDRSGRVARLKVFSEHEFTVESARVTDRGLIAEPGEAAEWRTYGRFTVSLATGRKVLHPADVVFFRHLDPNDRHQGLAPLKVALSQLNLSHVLQNRISKALQNAAMLSGILAAKQNLTDEQFARTKSEIRGMWSGMENSGIPGLTEGDMDWKSMMFDFRQFAYGELEREVEAKVCLAFRIRPEVLGAQVGLENSPWSHIETARRLAYEDGIEPLWKRYERAITRQLLRPVDENRAHIIAFDRTKVPALQADYAKAAKIVALIKGDLSRNERRAMIGKEPTNRPEDDQVQDAPAPPRIPPPLAPAAPEDEKTVRIRVDPQTKATKAADPDVAWKLFDQVTRAQEFGWTTAAEAQLKADRTATLSLVRDVLGKSAPAPERKDDDDPAVARDLVEQLIRQVASELDFAREWKDRVEPLTESTARRAIEAAAVELDISFDLLQPGLLEYVQREAAWLVTEVTDTTKQAIRDALEQALEKGEGIRKITKRIEDLSPFERSRAELIARTETTRVTNGAQRDSLAGYAAESGRKVMKTWLATRDARTRDEHVALDGKQVGIDEAFSNGLQAPGEPNCRCTLIYAIAEEV